MGYRTQSCNKCSINTHTQGREGTYIFVFRVLVEVPQLVLVEEPLDGLAVDDPRRHGLSVDLDQKREREPFKETGNYLQWIKSHKCAAGGVTTSRNQPWASFLGSAVLDTRFF